MTLRADQLEHFQTHGYLNAGRVFTADEVAEIRAAYDALVTLEAQTLGNDEQGRFPYRAMLSFRSEALRRYINHPALLERVAQILGPDLRFWWDQGINKLPGSGSPIPWHQDNGYQNGRVPEYLTTWLALDDSSAENGGLQVVPGSHRRGLQPHEPWNEHMVIPEADVEGAIDLDARAGETFFFSTLLVHQTVGNHTADRQRRAWVMQYGRGDARDELTGTPCDDRLWVMQAGEIVDEPWSERRLDLRG